MHQITKMNKQLSVKILRDMIQRNSNGLLSLLGCFIIHVSLGSFYCFGNLTTYMTSYMKNTTSPNITYGDFVIVQSGMPKVLRVFTNQNTKRFISLKILDVYCLRNTIFSSVWNVTRSHPSPVRLRGSIYWIEKCNNYWMRYISNCDISYVFYSSTH